MAESVKKLLYSESLGQCWLWRPIGRQPKLGEFDLGTQRDFGKHVVKARVPAALPECAGRDLEAGQSRRIGDTSQQGELEGVKRIQHAAPAFDTAAAALRQVLEALQGDERINAAERPRRGGRGGRPRRFFLAEREGSRGGSPLARGGDHRAGTVGSINAHERAL